VRFSPLANASPMALSARVSALLIAALAPAVFATQIQIHGPVGSGTFGEWVSLLPNGNIVVTDPDYTEGAIQKVGAVYLFGPTGFMISKLTGSTANDRVGNGGVTVLTNGNFVIRSYDWDNGSIVDAGAVTWMHAAHGLSGVVSAQNSLVGSQQGDSIGRFGVQALLRIGHYVVSSPYWNNGALGDVGAVTWGNGLIGIAGPVSSTNSWIGTNSGDELGYELGRGNGVLPLGNGNYVIVSCGRFTTGAGITVSGAVTWSNGTRTSSGTLSSSNSLIGTECYDPPNTAGSIVTRFFNGDYVVTSPSWDNGNVANVGAATWGSGAAGVNGEISSARSLVGDTAGDFVGGRGVRILANGNYVILSPSWRFGLTTGAGAVTFAKGGQPLVGTVSAANSLVGAAAGDSVGRSGILGLRNGNYVVPSPNFSNGDVVRAGAVTWGNGTTGTSGVVSVTNSLIGTSPADRIGLFGLTPLGDTGHYMLASYDWDNGTLADAGALTWGNGNLGVSGVISATNSLVGMTAGDRVGSFAALANGNYAALNPNWDNGGIVDAGAVTWANGSEGVTGTISPSNSLIGTIAGDSVGIRYFPLPNGDYAIGSMYWDNGALADVGAVTHLTGNAPIVGFVTAANSLIGGRAGDRVGSNLAALRNGHYVIGSAYWSDDNAAEVGAVTWVNGNTGLTGVVSASNSLVGSSAQDRVGENILTFNNGNYLITSDRWDNGALTDVGAITWANGSMRSSGAVSVGNSLIGTHAGDRIGIYYDPGGSGTQMQSAIELKKGNFYFQSALFDNAGLVDAGALTWGRTDQPVSGMISPINSVFSNTTDGFDSVYTLHDPRLRRLVISQRSDNKVTLVLLQDFGQGVSEFESKTLESATTTPLATPDGVSTQQDHHCKLHPPIGHVFESQGERADGCGDQRSPPRHLIRTLNDDGEIHEQAVH